MLLDDEKLYCSQGDTSGKHIPKKIFVEAKDSYLTDDCGTMYLDMQMFISRKLIILKLYFNYLTEHNYIETNYYCTHNFKFRKERKLPKTLSVKESEKLLTYAKKQTDAAKTDFEI